MRLTLAALLAAGFLALAAGPAATSGLLAPAGEYHGTSQHHGKISFLLNAAHTEITNFRVSGHILMAKAAFHHSSNSIGSFGATSHGVHVWGSWPAEHYPLAAGGYSYDNGTGKHVVSHWSARIP